MPRGRAARILSSAAVVTALCCGSEHAAAQTASERADARAVADEGARAFQRGEFDVALSLFQRAEALVHSPVHLLFVARSQEKLGQLVEAREAYLAIGREVLGAAAPRAFVDAIPTAAAELEALERRLPHVTLEVEGRRGRRVLVSMNGQRLPPEILGIKKPINPGVYEFLATSSGRKSRPRRVTIQEGDAPRVVLRLEALQPGDDDTSSEDDEAPAAPRPAPRADGDSGAPVGAFIGFGVGVIGVGVGTLFAVQSGEKRAQANDLCTVGGACPKERRPQIEALDADADSLRNTAVAAFAVGGVGIALGVTLLLVSSGGDGTATATVSGFLGPREVGLRGRF